MVDLDTVAVTEPLSRSRLPTWLQGTNLTELIAVIATLALGGVVLGYWDRTWTFTRDEWGTIEYRRAGGISAFLAAHNGHLQAVVVAVYRILFLIVGLRTYLPYSAVIIAAHLILVGLFYLYARRRIGIPLASFLSLLLLFLGAGWRVIFWAINLGFVIPLIVFALLLISNRWRPWLVAIGIAVALASSGLGDAIVAGAFVMAFGQDRRARNLIAVGIPSALYGAWFIFYRPHVLPPAVLRDIPGAIPTGDLGNENFPLSNLNSTVSYMSRAAEAAANGLTGTPTAGWLILLVVAVGGLAVILVRRRVTFRLMAILATTIVYWFELSAARAQVGNPSASRYIYPAAFFIAFFIVEVLSGLRLQNLEFRGVRLHNIVVLVVAIAVCVALIADADTFRTESAASAKKFAKQTMLLHHVQCDPRLPASYIPDLNQDPQLTVGPYLAAVKALGSPAGQSCRK
jgi:hypothetical protein